jgi:hypothetical protein
VSSLVALPQQIAAGQLMGTPPERAPETDEVEDVEDPVGVAVVELAPGTIVGAASFKVGIQ